MSKSLFLFFSFCSIYLILLFLGDFEINFSSFFLWNALQNKTLIFILIGIGIFWSGKEVIDEKEGEDNRYSNILKIISFIWFVLICINNVIYYNFETSISWYINNQYFITWFISILLWIFFYSKKNSLKNKNTWIYEWFNRNNYWILFIIFLIFIISRIWFSLIYTGNYIDEYNHLFSWIDFFQNGNFSIFNNEWEYFRWAFLSVYIGIIFAIFWKSLLIAKLAMVLFAILSFFFLYKITQLVFEKRFFRYLTLILFTINPFILFEHIYIRPYAIYETSLLFILYIFFKISQYIKENAHIKILFSLFLINGIGFIIYIFSEKDVHRYIILLVWIFLSTYLYLFEFEKLQIKSKILWYFFSRTLKTKLLFLALLVPVWFYLFNIYALIIAIIENKAYHGSMSISKYYSLFFGEYLVFTLLSIFAGWHTLWKIIKTKKIWNYDIIILISITLFSAHLLSNINTHLVRWIIYLLPIYFLLAVYGYSMILKKNHIWYSIILVVLIWLSYPSHFLKTPYLPWEINYVEYKKIADFLKTNCTDKTIVWLVHNPYIFEFYDVKMNYTTNLYIEEKEQKAKYISENNSYFTIYKNIPVLTSMKALKEKIASNACIVLNEESKHYWYYFDNNEIDFLEKNFTKVQYGTQTPVNIYYN